LLEGYRSILPHGVYPVAFLFVDIPLEEIDVNVHPAKTEIRFRRTEAVKDAIAEAVRNALAIAGIVAEIPNASAPTSESIVDVGSAAAGPNVEIETFVQAEIGFDVSTEVTPSIDVLAEGGSEAAETQDPTVTYDELPLSAADFELMAQERTAEHESAERSVTMTPPVIGEIAGQLAPLPPVNSASHLAKPAEVDGIKTSSIRPLGQLHESFIIAVDDEGLLLVDQHVAHERILFDKFRRSETDRSIESQNLLLPETLDLSPAQLSAFSLVENDLASLGFGVMRLSGRTIAIKSIPTDLPASETRNLLCEILDSVDPEKRGGAKATFRDDIAASLACRAAVKINMKLTPEKMQWLIDRLLTTSSPTTCPHGRPVILRLSMRDIERGFHRT
jgi:DNA mismatch repair protein MutL